MNLPLLGAVLLLALSVGWEGTRRLATELRRRAILDHPNERSSHSVPTPRGGGLAIMVALALCGGLAWALGLLSLPAVLVVGGAVILACLSFLDDVRTLSARLRFGAQAGIVLVGVLIFHAAGFGTWRVLGGLLPDGLDAAVALLAWLWFLNLYNFMDGIDGLSGVETLSITLGLTLVWWADGRPAILTEPVALALIAGAATAGFLRWNWRPARIFMGDVGSAPLGFLLAWALLALAGSGAWPAAAILPMFYLVDATATLLRRAARRERIWRAHRSHAYQRATQRGLSHGQVARRIAAWNGLLVAAAVGAVVLRFEVALALFATSLAATAGFVWWLAGPGGPGARA